MLDHVAYPVADYARSKAFYVQALAPLGYGLVKEVGQGGDWPGGGFGPQGRPHFWIATGTPINQPLHFAFMAQNRAAVDAFYGAALKAGGKDNGAPGLRPNYHANYYGAFVLDPDGYNIEAVCHLPE